MRRAAKVGAKSLRTAMLRRVSWRTKSTGNITFPAVPGLVDHYLEVLEKMFTALGRPFAKGEAAICRAILVEKIDWAFQRSHNAWVLVEWKTTPGYATSLQYTVTGMQKTIEETYAEWVKVREPPLFGKHPDARVMNLARTLGPAHELTVLDAGAGVGRNALPLAREGYVVDALELAPALVTQLEAAAKEANLDLRSVCANFYDRQAALPRAHYKLVVLSETCSHWRGLEDLRSTLTRLSELLEPGGLGLFNIFLSRPGYEPQPAEREFSQLAWCPIYTRADLAEVSAGLPLTLLSDESAADYEQAHLPKEAWPPTGWYTRWTSGSEVFDLPLAKSQFELRWLTFQRA